MLREKHRHRPCSQEIYYLWESGKPSLSADLLGVFRKLLCLSFPDSMENIMTTCLKRNTRTWGRKMCLEAADAQPLQGQRPVPSSPY